MNRLSHFSYMVIAAIIACLAWSSAEGVNAQSNGASATVNFPLAAFKPDTDAPLLFEHQILREGAGWQASTLVKRCVQFTRIGRGFRADSQVFAVIDEGPAKIVALLGLAQAIRKSEHLIFDLDGDGRVIGLRDEQASWDRMVIAMMQLKKDLPNLMDSPAGQVAGERLIDSILATEPDQRDAYLAEGFLPILGMTSYIAAGQQLPLILPDTQEEVRLSELHDDWMILSVESKRGENDGKARSGYTRSYGKVRLSRLDGMLLDSERTIETHVGTSMRISREKWRRLPLDAGKIVQNCNGAG